MAPPRYACVTLVMHSPEKGIYFKDLKMDYHWHTRCLLYKREIDYDE